MDFLGRLGLAVEYFLAGQAFDLSAHRIEHQAGMQEETAATPVASRPQAIHLPMMTKVDFRRIVDQQLHTTARAASACVIEVRRHENIEREIVLVEESIRGLAV